MNSLHFRLIPFPILLGLCSVLLCLTHPGKRAQANDIDFERDIWPIFVKHCHDCHNGDNQEGQLRLDAKTAFLAGGVSGNLIEAGKDGDSLLLSRLLGKGDLDQMPLDADPLTETQLKKITDWLKSGAKWPEHVGESLQPKKKHWAYEPIVRPRISKAKGTRDDRAWVLNPVDVFVRRKMQEQGLRPEPDADKGKLLRRVYLDLIGLPPTLDELRAFLKDDSAIAYEHVVDRLLASPAFGEKWSRPWLDLARYADTNGFQADQFRSVWPYRDWVINAMNDDMPFSQFTVEQLAGDLLPKASLEQRIASGFHRLTTCNVEAGVDPEQNRVNQIFDRVNTTGTVWFGTSFECMQCHNHKYDPFTQREYYQMFAFFNKTPMEVKDSGNNIQYEFYGPQMDLPLSAKKQKAVEEIQSTIASLKREIKEFEISNQKNFLDWLSKNTKQSDTSETWTPLKIVQFDSRGGAGHKILDDHSVLLTGKNPDKDFYTLIIETELKGINGFKFETLTHKSLPANGPGRHAVAGRPNFVVYEIKASFADDAKRLIPLVAPLADFSQNNFSVKGLVDGRADTGWAINPRFGKNHWASVLTKTPIGSTNRKTRIRFTFDQHYGGGRNIGRLRISALTGRRTESKIPDEIRKLRLLPVTRLTETQRLKLKKHFFSQNKPYVQLQSKLAAANKKLAGIKPTTTLVMMETEDRMTSVFKRGNFLDRGEPVTPGTPATLHSLKTSQPKNRLDFANWIIDSQNPLTARVVVNRWWQEIFGRGIVATGEDFGTQGQAPSHPELLDWLATELIASGWSRKRIIREIVTSRTYRQSSSAHPRKRVQDPHNIYLARGPRIRMSAETIRDNFLVVSSHLASKVGGPPVFPPQPDGIWRHVGRNAPKYETSTGTDRFRRGIYVFWRRSAPYPSFVNFDAPDRASCVVNRGTTNTPLQALTLLNDQAFVEICREFGMSIFSQENSDHFRIADAFLACTMRDPETREVEFLANYLSTRLTHYRQNPKQAVSVAGQTENAAEIAAWINLAQILFNLDESITKD